MLRINCRLLLRCSISCGDFPAAETETVTKSSIYMWKETLKREAGELTEHAMEVDRRTTVMQYALHLNGGHCI